MTWTKTYPVLSGDTISASVTQIRANWEAIASALSGEHVALTDSLSGTHLYGRVSSMLSGTYATIAALSSPASGALAWDTTCGVCRIYDGTTWQRITGSYFSRVKILTTTPQSIPASSWTSITLAKETGYYDSLDEFTASTNYLVVKASGWYFIRGLIVWPYWTAALDYQKKAGIYIGISTLKTSDTKYGREELLCEVADIINLTAGDTIYLAAYHNYTSNISISSATLTLTRLS